MKFKPVNYRNVQPNKYMAGDDGHVYTLDGEQVEEFLYQKYLYVNLITTANNLRKFPIYRIILASFVGHDCPGMDVDHWDCNHFNNKPENLEFVTRSENIKRAQDNGLWNKPRNVFTDKDIHALCKCYQEGMNVRKALRTVGIDPDDTNTMFAYRVFTRQYHTDISKHYTWNVSDNLRKVYTNDDIRSIAMLLRLTDYKIPTKDIVKRFTKYNEKQLTQVIKKMRQRKLYKSVINEVDSLPKILLQPRDGNGFIILVKRVK